MKPPTTAVAANKIKPAIRWPGGKSRLLRGIDNKHGTRPYQELIIRRGNKR
jgi:hypothetical protein